MVSLRYAALSDVGPVRKNNQDSGYAGSRLLVVADGIGGQAAGDLASSLVVQTMRRLDEPLDDNPTDPAPDVLQALAGAVHRANDRLAEVIEDDPSVDGMGTTLTALVLDGDRFGLAHVGDSRGYLLRDGSLSRITTDHTFVQQLIDEGRISEDEARTHPHRSLIMRALDGRHSVEPDLSAPALRIGDRILLCSDGLSGYVDEDTIAATLGDGTVELATTELVRLALEARTTDNVTCVVGEVVEASHEGATDEPHLVGAAAEQPRPRRAGTRRTAEHPAIRDPDDDEDHGGLDPDIDPEEARYAPRAERRFPRTRRLLVLVLVLALLAAGVWYAYEWSQNQFYVAESDGNVAIYRGVEQDLPGLTLTSVEDRTDLPVADLPDFAQARVADGITANNLADAEAIVASLDEQARDCARGGRSTEECEGAGSTEPTPSEPTTTPTGGNDGGGGNAGGGGGGGG